MYGTRVPNLFKMHGTRFQNLLKCIIGAVGWLPAYLICSTDNGLFSQSEICSDLFRGLPNSCWTSKLNPLYFPVSRDPSSERGSSKSTSGDPSMGSVGLGISGWLREIKVHGLGGWDDLWEPWSKFPRSRGCVGSSGGGVWVCVCKLPT